MYCSQRCIFQLSSGEPNTCLLCSWVIRKRHWCIWVFMERASLTALRRLLTLALYAPTHLRKEKGTTQDLWVKQLQMNMAVHCIQLCWKNSSHVSNDGNVWKIWGCIFDVVMPNSWWFWPVDPPPNVCIYMGLTDLSNTLRVFAMVNA